MEQKVKAGRWTKYGGRLFAWVDVWARWWDWPIFAVWLFLIYFFGSWSVLSFQEYEPTAGWWAAGFTVIIALVGVGLRWLIYQFIQKRRKKQ